jgi:hypothetical protein
MQVYGQVVTNNVVVKIVWVYLAFFKQIERIVAEI